MLFRLTSVCPAAPHPTLCRVQGDDFFHLCIRVTLRQHSFAVDCLAEADADAPFRTVRDKSGAGIPGQGSCECGLSIMAYPRAENVLEVPLVQGDKEIHTLQADKPPSPERDVRRWANTYRDRIGLPAGTRGPVFANQARLNGMPSSEVSGETRGGSELPTCDRRSQDADIASSSGQVEGQINRQKCSSIRCTAEPILAGVDSCTKVPPVPFPRKAPDAIKSKPKAPPAAFLFGHATMNRFWMVRCGSSRDSLWAVLRRSCCRTRSTHRRYTAM